MTRKWRNQKDIPTPKTEVETKLNKHSVLILRTHFVHRVNRRSLNYPNLLKNMKTHIRCKQHKNLTPLHKTIKITTVTEVSHWNDQK